MAVHLANVVLFSTILRRLDFLCRRRSVLVKSPIPFNGGFGCTDYTLKNFGKVCKDSLHGYIVEVTKKNILLPTNLLLVVGLALANDFRSSSSVCSSDFVSPNTCPCKAFLMQSSAAVIGLVNHNEIYSAPHAAGTPSSRRQSVGV